MMVSYIYNITLFLYHTISQYHILHTHLILYIYIHKCTEKQLRDAAAAEVANISLIVPEDGKSNRKRKAMDEVEKVQDW